VIKNEAGELSTVMSLILSPLAGLGFVRRFQGLTPLANNCRPFGTKTGHKRKREKLGRCNAMRCPDAAAPIYRIGVNLRLGLAFKLARAPGA